MTLWLHSLGFVQLTLQKQFEASQQKHNACNLDFYHWVDGSTLYINGFAE